MNDDDFSAARRALGEARRQARHIDDLPAAWLPGDLAEAYRLQQAVTADLGDIRGWKVAAITAAQQATLHLAGPIAAPMLAPWMHDASTAPARLHRRDFIAPLLECEFAFVLGRDLPARRSPYTRDEVRQAVEALCLGIEIADPRLPRGLGVHAELADAFNHGAFIAGPLHRDWQRIDFASTQIELSFGGDAGGRTLATGSGRAILDGDPFGAVVLLANVGVGADTGRGLRAGDVVTTGSCTGAPALPGPGKCVAVFGALGRVEFEFD